MKHVKPCTNLHKACKIPQYPLLKVFAFAHFDLEWMMIDEVSVVYHRACQFEDCRAEMYRQMAMLDAVA